MKGNASNLTLFSKFFDFLSKSSQPNNANKRPFLMKLRLFSSFDGNNGRKNRFDDQSGDKDGNFSRNDGRNFSAQQKFSPPHHSNNGNRRGRRDDGFNKPFNGEGSRTNNMKSSYGFPKLDGKDEGRLNGRVGGDEGVDKGARPSISELLNKPLKSEKGIGEEDQGSKMKTTEEEKIEPPEEADVIFKKMKQTGLIPNAVNMLDGLCKDGLVQEAMKLFGVMREKGTMPEVVVYTAVVEGFCKAQKLDDAKRIFKKMQSNGVVPNAFSYSVLIKGLCKDKRLEDAVDYCVEMLEAGHSPNVATFTGLVHDICKEKGVDEAKKIIGTLKQKGFLLDDKAVRTHLDKTGPTSPMVWEAIFGSKKTSPRIL